MLLRSHLDQRFWSYKDMPMNNKIPYNTLSLLCACFTLLSCPGTVLADLPVFDHYTGHFIVSSSTDKTGPVAAAPSPIPTETSVIAGQQASASSVVSPVYAPEMAVDLGTRTGIEVGGQASYYRYQEHVNQHPEFIHEIGPKVGITATGTKSFESGLFVVGDFRFAYGQNHYHSVGTGTQNGLSDYMGEVRVLGGKDFILADARHGDRFVGFDISPYIGLGYRNLLNDWSGTTSTGAFGYRRDSQYLYLPIGLTQRLGLGSRSRLATNIEYDQLLQGWQTSYLSDFGSPRGDVTNTQDGGYGLRGSIMYEEESWSLGPFFDYWNIDRANPNAGWDEPHNQTVEYGLQGRYHF